MRIAAVCAGAATVLGVALLVAADGAARTMSWAIVGNVTVALVLVGVGAPLARLRDGRRIGLLLFGGGTAMVLGIAGGGYAAVGRTAGWPAVGSVDRISSDVLWAFAVIPLSTVLFVLFPDGRPPTPRWRPAVWLGWGATALAAAAAAAGGTAAPVTGAVWTAAGLAGLAALAVRWRRAEGVARQQLKYLLLAGLLVLLLYTVADLLPYHAEQAAYLAVPLLLVGAVAGAVLRYRLYDVDVVIRRTVVFAGVTGLVFLTYVGVAAALGATASERAALTASVVVAAVAEPARRRIQRATTGLLFGRRDEPLAALGLLRDRMRDATDETQLAAAVTDVVPRLLRTRTVALRLLRDGETREVARVGPAGADTAEFPLVHQSELLGTLLVGLRQPGVPFGRADTVLLDEIAHQVAAAAHAVRLRAELRAAADRAHRAAEAERERLRRELHDRLGPLLVGTGLTVDGLRRSAPGEDLAGLLEEVAAQLRSASGEVRRIVDRLQPAALLELGLVEAVRDHLDRLAALPGVPSSELVVRGVGPLPAAVQEAAYALVLEAVTNTLRHADATALTVRIQQDGPVLEVAVTDDGRGLARPYVAGVGIGSMRRRAVELGGSCTLAPAPGGGTHVHATFPLEVPWTTPPPRSGSWSPTTTPSSGWACDGSSTPSRESTSWARPRTPRRSSPRPSR
ncbi:sensor histidine kinase [Modestobacter sp. URMC 112]